MVDIPSIASVHIGQVIGLLEILEDYGGRVDMALVSNDLVMPVDDLLPVVNAAEFLGLLRVSDGDLELTEKGKKLLSCDSKGRKRLLNKILSSLPPFKQVVGFISRRDGESAKQSILELIRKEMPDVDPERLFLWIVEWGRYALLLRYDMMEGKVRLIRE
jgi:NitT/TauT family transport system ATP-binding protein